MEKTKNKRPLDQLDERELIRLDLRGFNRGELQTYMHELQFRRRQKKSQLETLDTVIRDVASMLSKGSV